MAPIATLTTLLQKVELLRPYGMQPSKKFDDLVGRWRAFAGAESPQYVPMIAEAVVSGVDPFLPIDVLQVLACAHATADTMAVAGVRNEVARRVWVAVLPEVEKFVGAGYDAVRDSFNDAAARFVAAVAAADPDAAPESLMDATSAARLSWADAPAVAAELDSLLDPLQVAAELAGHKHALFDLAAEADDTPASVRREVWSAWDEPGASRGGRWTALARLEGVRIVARELDQLCEYRRPQPMETRYRQGNIGFRQYEYDPELGAPEAGSFSAR